jgi:DNA helicase-2/ATP-dependent DNA helicase PcrA
MVVAIHQWPYQCRAVARQLGGQYSCVEAIDEGDLYEAAAQLDQSKGMARAVVVLEFAEKCVTKVGNELRAIRDALAKGRIPAVRKHKTYLDSLVALENAPIVEVLPVLRSLSQMGVVYRRELLREMERAITAVSVGEAASLAEAVWLVRDRTRRYGRHLWRHSVSTTPLVKGLQFDRAVVLDADALQNSRHLYVALTRATKSLTIVSRSRQIQHAPDAGTRSRSH